MSRTVSGDLKEDPAEIVARLEKLAAKHDIEFNGDTEAGYAKGKGFLVEYQVQGRFCTLTCKKKPMLLPWSVVENAMNKVLGD